MRSRATYAMNMSGPASKPKKSTRQPAFAPHPDDKADVHTGVAEGDRGEGVQLSHDEVEQWANTGELACLESSSSRLGS
jgi:hypothetical protein